MSPVEYSRTRGCARITLTDGDRGNPIHRESVAALFAAVRQAADDNARVIVLAAEGRFFSVGGDLAAFAGSDDLAGYVDDLADSLHRVVSELIRSDAVVVAVVQGAAAGAGFALAAAADIVIAAESARFTVGYTKVGLSVDGGTSLLAHTLGLHRLLRLALLNDSIGAVEAHALGLVARVAPDDQLRQTADTVIGQLLAGPAAALAAIKQLLRDAVEPAPESVLRREALAIRANAASGDGDEGVRAFLDKRPPGFAP